MDRFRGSDREQDTDHLCQECESLASVMIYCPSEYVDRFYCEGHAIEWRRQDMLTHERHNPVARYVSVLCIVSGKLVGPFIIDRTVCELPDTESLTEYVRDIVDPHCMMIVGAMTFQPVELEGR